MRVLITGGGYIGGSLCQTLLNNGYEVRVIDNFFRGNCDHLIRFITNPSFEFMRGDVTSIKDLQNAIKDIDFVYHLAALVGEPRCREYEELAKAVNVGGTTKLIDVLNKQDKYIPLVFASTGSVYGIVKDEICTEETPRTAVSIYGQTKIDCEDYIRKYYPSGIILRFTTAFGLGLTTRLNLLINDFTHRAINQKHLTVFEPDVFRSFVCVRDIASALVHTLENNTVMMGDTYNIGSNANNATKRDIVELIKYKTGCAVTYIDYMSDPDTRFYKTDFSKIEKTGWQPTVSISHGIDELIKANSLLRIKHNYE